MRKVIVELTEEEYQAVEKSAQRLHLRGPEEWLRLAGLNFRISFSGSDSVGEVRTESQASIEHTAVTSNLSGHFFKLIFERLLDALANYQAELKRSAGLVAQMYLDGKVANKKQFTDPAIGDAWRSDLLNTDLLLAVLQHLASFSYSRHDDSDKSPWQKTKERWPYRISYGGLKTWLSVTHNVELDLRKEHPRCFYWYLDYLRDVWVHFGESLEGDHGYLKAIDGIENPGPHMLVVRADNGQPGRGGFDPSPLLGSASPE